MSNGVPDIGDLSDTPPAKGGKTPDIGELTDAPPASSKPDSGYLPAAGRFLRGAGVEMGRQALSAVPYLPGMPSYPVTKAATGVLEKKLPRPKDRIESAGAFAGNILPAAAVPELGLAGLAARSLPQLPRFAGLLGKLAEGGIRGGVGAAMQPESDVRKTGIGAATGVGSAAANTALNALPWHIRRALEAAAAGYATWGLTRVGLPKDFHASGPAFWALYNASLLDLATRINPAVTGAITSRAVPAIMDRNQ